MPIPMGYPAGVLNYLPNFITTHAVLGFGFNMFVVIMMSVEALYVFRWQVVLPSYHPWKYENNKIVVLIHLLNIYLFLPGGILSFTPTNTPEIQEKVLAAFLPIIFVAVPCSFMMSAVATENFEIGGQWTQFCQTLNQKLDTCSVCTDLVEVFGDFFLMACGFEGCIQSIAILIKPYREAVLKPLRGDCYLYMKCEKKSFIELYIGVLKYSYAFVFVIAFTTGYCILFKSPDHMKKYKWLLLISVINGFIFETVYNFIGVPVAYMPIPMGYPAGVLNYLPNFITTHATLAFGFNMFGVIMMSVEALYVFRWQVVLPSYHPLKYENNKIIVLLHLLNIYLLFPGWILFFTPANTLEIQKKVLAKYECLTKDDVYHERGVVFDIDLLTTKLGLGLSFLQHIIFSTSISLKTWHVYAVLKTNTGMSEKTKKLQYQLMKSLCIQAFLPIILVAVPCSFMMSAIVTESFEIGVFGDLFLMACGFEGCIQSIAVLFLIKPYRLTVMRPLRFIIPKRFNEVRSSAVVVDPKSSTIATSSSGAI